MHLVSLLTSVALSLLRVPHLSDAFFVAYFLTLVSRMSAYWYVYTGRVAGVYLAAIALFVTSR